MSSRLKVILDAGLFAVPDYEISTREEVQSFFSMWQKLIYDGAFDNTYADVLVSDKASEALLNDEAYPLQKRLTELVQKFNFPVPDAKDMFRTLNHRLSDTARLEHTMFVSDLLWEQFETDPKIQDTYRLKVLNRNNLLTLLQKCIVLTAILRKHCSSDVGSLAILLNNESHKEIDVRARVDIIEHDREDLTIDSDLNFSGNVLVCDNFQDCLNSLDALNLFKNAENNLEVKLAISIAKMNLLKEQSGTSLEYDSCSFRVGCQFRQIYQKVCKSKNDPFVEKVLRTIVDCLLGLNRDDEHKLRIDSGGDSPQIIRSRDGARAFRRKIDYYRRLHYWKYQDNTIEFASVSSYHDDFSIPECN